MRKKFNLIQCQKYTVKFVINISRQKVNLNSTFRLHIWDLDILVICVTMKLHNKDI